MTDNHNHQDQEVCLVLTAWNFYGRDLRNMPAIPAQKTEGVTDLTTSPSFLGLKLELTSLKYKLLFLLIVEDL